MQILKNYHSFANWKSFYTLSLSLYPSLYLSLYIYIYIYRYIYIYMCVCVCVWRVSSDDFIKFNWVRTVSTIYLGGRSPHGVMAKTLDSM